MANLASKTADALKKAVQKHQAGDTKGAEKLYKQVLKNHSDNFLANNYFGVILMGKGQYKPALKHFQTALKNKPGWPEAHLNIAQAALKLEDFETAKPHAEKVTKADPKNYKAWICLGNARYALGDANGALKAYQKAVEANPNDAGGYNSIGGVYGAHEAYSQARPWFEKALACNPVYTTAWNNLGVALRYTKEYDLAFKAFDKALELQPGYASPLTSKAELLTFLSGSEKALELYEDILDSPDITPAMYSNYLMALHYAPDVPQEKIFNAHKEWGKRFADRESPKLCKKGKRQKKEEAPIKVGLVSASFRRHPVGYMIVAAMENINPRKLELYYYSDNTPKKNDDLTQRLQKTAKQWTEIKGLPDLKVAEKIRADHIDVLIDLAGHSDGSRLGMFGLRPAPVQVEWVGGLFDTSGLEDMDWIIGDPVEIPEGDEKWYTEQVYRMPDDYVCYDPPDYLPDVGPLPARENGYITFANFNNGPKTNSKSIKLWADVLKAAPDSKLMLKNKIYEDDFVKNDLIEKIEAHGVSADRIIFRCGTPHEEHLKALNEVDIALDPYPYTGGLTTCESLMMGVPTITWPGPHFAGKHSATHLTAAGYPELIAESAEDYVQKATDLAKDLKKLASYRVEMRDNVLASPLCDANRFARNFEKAIKEMLSGTD